MSFFDQVVAGLLGNSLGSAEALEREADRLEIEAAELDAYARKLRGARSGFFKSAEEAAAERESASFYTAEAAWLREEAAENRQASALYHRDR